RDLHHVADVEGDVGLGGLARAGDAEGGEHARLLLGGERYRVGGGADEARDARGVAHHLPGLVGLVRVVTQVHLDEDVAWEELLGLHLLVATRLDHDLLGGDHDLVDAVGHPERAGAVQDVLLGLLFVPHVGVDGVPLDAHALTPIWCLAPRPRPQTMKPIRLPSVRSATNRKSAVSRTKISVAWVAWMTSRRVGHVTRPSSAREFLRYCPKPLNIG